LNPERDTELSQTGECKKECNYKCTNVMIIVKLLSGERREKSEQER
jgi:hypothetical protein